MRTTKSKPLCFDSLDGERSFTGSATFEVAWGTDNGGWQLFERFIEIEGTIEDETGATYAIWPGAEGCPDWIVDHHDVRTAIEDGMEEAWNGH